MIKMSTLKTIYNKHREKLWYIVFGVLTTLVGWATFTGVIWAWRAAFSLPTDDNKSQLYFVGFVIAQVLHWVAAVLFAYLTNRTWVFASRATGGAVLREAAGFFGGRVATLLFEEAVIWVFIKQLALPAMPVKLCVQVAIVILNYLISKLIVFRKKK